MCGSRRSGRWGRKQEFVFGDMKFEMPVRHPVEMSVEPGVVHTGDINLGLVSKELVFTAVKRLDEAN